MPPARSARVVERRPLLAPGGGHVRAGSGLAWWRGRLAVVQDDTRSLALVDPPSGAVELLPFGGTGADAKRDKLDLEALVALDDELLAFGSGSTGQREVVVRLRPGRSFELCPLPELYRRWRETTAFSGSELNVEGVTRLGEALLLFQRGNGKPARGLEPVNASARLGVAALLAHLASSAAPPELRDVQRHDLGSVDGVPLTFTDAAALAGRVFYLASAEASPDTYRDGLVVGGALGVLGEGPPVVLQAADGGPFVAKAEGLALLSRSVAFAVVDADDPSVPADLCRIELSGF